MKRSKIPNLILSMLCIIGCFCIMRALFVFGILGHSTSLGMIEWSKRQILSLHCPAFLYMEETNIPVSIEDVSKEAASYVLPMYGYFKENPQYVVEIENQETIEEMIRNEGRDELHEPIPEQSLEHAMEEENRKALEEAAIAENEAGADAGEIKAASSVDFLKAGQKAMTYELSNFQNFDTLMKEFYVLDKVTSISPEQLNINTLTSIDVKMKNNNKNPQILIYHTHSQEGFVDSIPGDTSTTIVGAGEKLARLLRDYGYNVIHDTGEYDVASRDYAYSNAAPAIEQILSKHPSIEVIIDLHRDGVAEGTRLVTDVNGRPTAQFMFFNGLSRTKKNGDIAYLKNENIQENLAFSFQAQLRAKEYYPGLARRIYLKGYRYNMHYRGKSLLIEVGAQTNTVEEVMNAIDPIAHVLYMTMSPEEP